MKNKQSCGCVVCGAPLSPLLTLRKAVVQSCPECGHEATVEFPAGKEMYGLDYFQATHHNWFNNPDMLLFEQLAGRFLKAGGRSQAVLDVGCGVGNFLHFLAYNGFTNLHGVDVVDLPSQIAFTYHKQMLEKFESPMRFDVVVSLASIEHVKNIRLAMERLSQLVRPGGQLIIYTVCTEGTIYRVAKILNTLGFTLPADRLYDPHHINHFSLKSLGLLAQQYGFKQGEVELRNMPMKAVDLPTGPLAPLLRLGVWGLGIISRLVGAPMLQLVCFSRGIDN